MSRRKRQSRGFTIIELMVALTGGMFVIVAVFALARDSGRFYQRETRVANATIGGLLGFDRLRGDIARAGFLASPNITKDIRVCDPPQASWPQLLRNLSAVQITQPAASTNAALLANGRNPPTLLLAGSYASPDNFAAKPLNNGTTVTMNLEPGRAALLRLGNGVNPDTTTMQSVFGAGRALRIVQKGLQYYGQIVTAAGGLTPSVTISNTAPPIQFRSGSASGCGLQPFADGAAVTSINVVNFIQYSVGAPQTAAATAAYAEVFAQSLNVAGESTRTELLRTELNLAGAAIDGTEEIVAEYAVDLNLQVSAVTALTGCCNPTVTLLSPGDATYAAYTGSVFGTTNTPQRMRSVRARLGVRSREGDRVANVPSDAGAGLFRFNVGTGTNEPFARVRTFQADIALHNQADILW
jgi:Tfp pilus assembly protein PilW